MDKTFKLYMHHGREVTVQEDLKGKHRDYCLCYSCDRFAPDSPAMNCPIANVLFALDQLEGIVTPVWECPKFIYRGET